MTHAKNPELSALIKEFLAAAPEDRYSVREAAAAAGIPHTTIAELRRGGVPRLHQATQRKMRAFIDAQRIAPRGESVTAALLRVAERLEQLAAELRKEAGAKPPRKGMHPLPTAAFKRPLSSPHKRGRASGDGTP